MKNLIENVARLCAASPAFLFILYVACVVAFG